MHVHICTQYNAHTQCTRIIHTHTLALMFMCERCSGEVVVGNSEEAEVKLGGALVLPHHCTLTFRKEDGTPRVALKPATDALVFVNGSSPIHPSISVCLSVCLSLSLSLSVTRFETLHVHACARNSMQGMRWNRTKRLSSSTQIASSLATTTFSDSMFRARLGLCFQCFCA